MKKKEQRISYNFRPRKHNDISSHRSSSNKESLINSFNPFSNSYHIDYQSITHNHTFNKEESDCSTSIDEEQSSAPELGQGAISRQ